MLCSKRDWIPPVLVPAPRWASATGLRKSPELGQDSTAKPSGHPRQDAAGLEAPQSSGCLWGRCSEPEAHLSPQALTSELRLWRFSPKRADAGGENEAEGQNHDLETERRSAKGTDSITCHNRLSRKLISTAETSSQTLGLKPLTVVQVFAVVVLVVDCLTKACSFCN